MSTVIAANFPEKIALGAQSNPEWSTEVVMVLGGQEVTNQNWDHAKHQFDISFAIRDVSDYALVRAHFHMARGRARFFLFKDFLDHTCTTAEGALDATAVTDVYQLVKVYGSGVDAYRRRITRPVSPIAVFRTRTGSTTLIAPSIDYTTGLVTVTGHVSGDTYSWSGEFLLLCRYDMDRLPSIAANKRPGEAGELLVQCDAIMVVEVRE